VVGRVSVETVTTAEPEAMVAADPDAADVFQRA
jgi:hypothetical protein